MIDEKNNGPLPKVAFAGRFASAADVQWHTHPCTEIVLVTEGRCRIAAGALWVEGLPGTLCVLPASAPQYQETDGFTRTTYIGIDDETFDGTPRTVAMPVADPAARWMEDLCDLFQGPSATATLQMSALLLALLERIKGHEDRRRTMSALHPDLARAVAFLDAHFSDALTVTDIAHHAHLSTSHLTALFRERFGCGPLRYQQRLRMRHARSLLSDPYLTVAEVARRCGYEDASYFVRLFRALHGYPPGKWRGGQGETPGSDQGPPTLPLGAPRP